MGVRAIVHLKFEPCCVLCMAACGVCMGGGAGS